jgi:hypothetical protein
MPNLECQLINDAGIACLFSVSRSWVRKQRYLRRHELPHVFNIEPVMVGSCPRYRMRDVDAWIKGRSAEAIPSANKSEQGE